MADPRNYVHSNEFQEYRLMNQCYTDTFRHSAAKDPMSTNVHDFMIYQHSEHDGNQPDYAGQEITIKFEQDEEPVVGPLVEELILQEQASSGVQSEQSTQPATDDSVQHPADESLSPTSSHATDAAAAATPTKRDKLKRDPKSYSCQICHVSYSQASNLTIHMRTHTGEKPFMCPICEAKFTQKSNLDRHIRIHTGVRPYSCSVCESKFSQKTNLKKHMLIHSGEKPYGCAHCDARFAQENNMKRHMRTHTGDKPFSCELCDAKFTQKINLKKHVFTHTGDKDYECEQCSARFNQKGNMLTHMCRHGRVFRCETCDAEFDQKGKLKKHLRAHSEVVEPVKRRKRLKYGQLPIVCVLEASPERTVEVSVKRSRRNKT